MFVFASAGLHFCIDEFLQCLLFALYSFVFCLCSLFFALLSLLFVLCSFVFSSPASTTLSNRVLLNHEQASTTLSQRVSAFVHR